MYELGVVFMKNYAPNTCLPLTIALKWFQIWTPEKNDRICSKVNQVIYSSSPISWPSFKPLAQIVFKIACWQVPNFLTPEKFDGICSKVNPVIYSFSPISWPSFKPLAQICFKKHTVFHCKYFVSEFILKKVLSLYIPDKKRNAYSTVCKPITN